MKIIIPGELTDLNTYIDKERTNKFIASKIKKEMTQICYLYAIKHKDAIQKKANFKFTWYCKNQMKDPDNIAFARKFILDGFVSAKVIKNDGWKQIEGFQDVFVVDKENPRIEVEIREVS